MGYAEQTAAPARQRCVDRCRPDLRARPELKLLDPGDPNRQPTRVGSFFAGPDDSWTVVEHDGESALEWLTRAFGFQELAVYRNDEGVIVHAEIALGPGIVMFSPGDPDPPSNPMSHGVYVAVDNPDAHYERARAAGAEIVREIEDSDYGSREYTARDLEGHVWSFGSYRPRART